MVKKIYPFNASSPSNANKNTFNLDPTIRLPKNRKKSTSPTPISPPKDTPSQTNNLIPKVRKSVSIPPSVVIKAEPDVVVKQEKEQKEASPVSPRRSLAFFSAVSTLIQLTMGAPAVKDATTPTQLPTEPRKDVQINRNYIIVGSPVPQVQRNSRRESKPIETVSSPPKLQRKPRLPPPPKRLPNLKRRISDDPEDPDFFTPESSSMNTSEGKRQKMEIAERQHTIPQITIPPPQLVPPSKLKEILRRVSHSPTSARNQFRLVDDGEHHKSGITVDADRCAVIPPLGSLSRSLSSGVGSRRRSTSISPVLYSKNDTRELKNPKEYFNGYLLGKLISSGGPASPTAQIQPSPQSAKLWTETERNRMNEGLQLFGKNFQKISEYMFKGKKSRAELVEFYYLFRADLPWWKERRAKGKTKTPMLTRGRLKSIG